MFAYVTGAFNIINSINSSIETASFRSDVLADLKAIQTKLDAISSALATISAKADLQTLIDDMSNAPNTIGTTYAEPIVAKYLAAKGDYTSWTQTEKDQLEQFIASLTPDNYQDSIGHMLTAIHQGVMGKLTTNHNSWIDLFYNEIVLEARITKSNIEYLYLFFTQQVIYTQLQGLTLLSMTDSMGSWAEDLQANIILQAEKIQGKVDSLPDSDSWAGRHGGHVETRNGRQLRFGINEDAVPDGYVVTGFRIRTDDKGKLLLLLDIGKCDDTGYITSESKGQVYQMGTTDDDWNVEEDPSVAGSHTSYHLGYLDTTEISLPENHVVLNMGFGRGASYSKSTTFGQTSATYNHSGVYLIVKHGEIDANGNILTDTITQSSNGGSFESDGSSEGTPPSQWVRWNAFTYYVALNTPMTGARFLLEDSGFVPVAKDTIHKQSFAAPS